MELRPSKRQRMSAPAPGLITPDDGSMRKPIMSDENFSIPRRPSTASQLQRKTFAGLLINQKTPTIFTSESERSRWELVELIQSRPHTSGSGSFSRSDLEQLRQALQEDHSSYSEEDRLEKSKLLEAVDFRFNVPSAGAFNWADLNSMELILNTPFLESADKNFQELVICEDEVKAAINGRRDFGASAHRRLGRVLGRLLLYSTAEEHERITVLLYKVKSYVGRENKLGRDVWRSCLEILSSHKTSLPSDETIKRFESPEGKNTSRPQDSSSTKRSRDLSTDRLTGIPSDSHGESASLFAAELPIAQSESAPLPNSTLSAHLFDDYVNVESPFASIISLPHLRSIQKASNCAESAMTEAQAAILDLCFALVCVGPRAPAFPKATCFYRHGRSLMPCIEDSGDFISFLQCLVLQSQFLYATGNLKAAWEVIGLAIRKAQSLGIHREDGGSLAKIKNTQQMTRRIWHTIQIIERFLALQLGVAFRSLDATCNAPLPLSVSDDWASGIPNFPGGDASASLTGFLKASAELYLIVDDLVDVESEFRISETGCPLEQLSNADLDDLRKIDRSLTLWKESLPEFLQEEGRADDFDDENHVIRRLRLGLQLRYLYICLRVYRPLLIQGLALSLPCICASPEEVHMTGQEETLLGASLLLGLIRNASFKCMNAAHGIIKLLCEYSDSGTGGISCENATAARENLEYLYASGLVLIAARMVPFLMDYGKGRADSIKYVSSQLSLMPMLLRKFEKSSRQNRDMGMPFDVCQTALARLSAVAGDANDPGIISQHVGFDDATWRRLYARLNLELPSQNLKETLAMPLSPSPKNASMLFGWVESLPVDLYD